ncbi:MAG: AraC family transcriptional regulator [Nocardiopsaceae bacterium]|jgi:AraC-like DNA-binding protein|nr:AraC family transcriptional regulator [Nocardiopsaceae bacterium]
MSDATLQAMLQNLHLDGAIFLRAEYTEGWAYESPPAADLAGLLRPGRERLILFHVVAAGACWVACADGERHHAQRGDVIVLPYGNQHTMGGAAEADRIPIASLLDPPPWQQLPVIRYGHGGPRTDVVCGYLESDDPLFDPALAALPAVFVVRPSDAAARWVQASIDFAMATTTALSDTATRLPELLLTEILRLHLTSAPAASHGWLAALRDPVLAPALALLHQQPERRWTLRELAAAATTSRSTLDQRFLDLLGRSPIRYLADWRMHLAEDLLATTNLTAGAVASRVGYDAEEAFSRAFRRAHGMPPAQWRTARTKPQSP